MEPSDPDTSPWGRRVGPCAVHGSACPNWVAPGGGGGKRRRSRRALHHSSHWPHRGASDLPDGAHHHWSKGLTPGTTSASDRAINATFTDLADPSHAATTSTSASIHRSRLIGIRSTTGPVDSVRQPGALAVRSLCHPVLQRPCARVLGLNGRAKPLSSGDGRWGATPREVEKQERLGAGGAQQEVKQEGEFKI
jgi:hypothetical protein